jgi:tetratricopeptide (TPR) repeat protein
VFGNRVILFFLVGVVFAVSSEIHNEYSQALNAYQSGHYELSIDKYEHILSNDWESPQLYYNLGNAYYRIENIAGAIWAYEQTLFLDPNHKNAKFNLKRVNLNVRDRVDIPEAPFYLKQYLALKERFTPTEWLTIFTGLLCLVSLFYFLLHVTNGLYFRPFISLGIVVSCCTLFIFSHSVYTSNAVFEGIIFANTLEVNSEPNSQSIRLFDVHEGLKVSVQSQSQGWVEIELLDGKSGWIPLQNIKFIQ